MMVKVLSSCRQKDYFCGSFHFGNFNVINSKHLNSVTNISNLSSTQNVAAINIEVA